MNKTNDPLAGGQEMTTQTVTFGKVGNFIKGTYVGKRAVKNPNNEGMVNIYEVKGILGEFHEVDGKKNPKEPAVGIAEGSFYSIWGGKTAIDDLFGRVRLGEIVAIQFKEEVESKTKGNAPFKVLRCLTFGKDPSYMGQDSSSQEVEDVPFE